MFSHGKCFLALSQPAKLWLGLNVVSGLSRTQGSLRNALVRWQGSDGGWGAGREGDAKYTTPMAIIILATPYRCIPIYQR